MNANLQAPNRLANEIFHKQQLSNAETGNATEQYDALPVLSESPWTLTNTRKKFKTRA